VSCSHSVESKRWVKEGPLKATYHCSVCNRAYEVPGWAVRGSGESFAKGFREGTVEGARDTIIDFLFGKKR